MSTFVSLTDTTVVLNGHTLIGWSDDADALMLPDVDLASVVRGADGKMAATSTGNRGGEVQIKLMANSPSTQWMMQRAVEVMGGATIEFNGLIRHHQMGVSIRLSRGVLTKAPLGQTTGKGEAATRVFSLEFELILPNYDGARFTAPPDAG